MTGNIVVIKDLSYKYAGAAEFALQEISLQVRQGEFLGVMGPTGAGKTTFCLALNGVVPHFYGGDFYGSITVVGLDTVEHPTYKLAQRVGMVFQDPEMQLTAPTVAAEVAFALENICLSVEEIKRRVPAALKAVRLEGLEGKHPHQLSGGQKQRLAIAAALALQPDVLVLDEPTSQLDPVGTDEVFAIVRELNRTHGITIILVSHASEEIAEYADRVMLLAEGKLLGLAPPGEFFQNIDLLWSHGVRPPEVTQTFRRIFLSLSQKLAYPVTLPEALDQYSQLRPRLSFEPVIYPNGHASTASNEIVLQTENLHYTYDDGTRALEGVSVDIRRGEYVAIVGQNGGGKSTLVRHFLHLLTASSGQVKVFGRDVSTYEVSELAQHIGYVSQNPDNQIFSDTVEREVAFALTNLRFPKDEVQQRVAAALKEMKLDWAAGRHPLTLSKGDRSRIVVAAILAMKPDVLIFDEPTTGQDYQGAQAILELTGELHRAGKTIIVITHHLYLLPGYAERLLVMGKGQLLLDGPLREIFYQTAKLRETFLTAPQVIRLAEAMQAGSEARLRPLTAEELAATITIH
ncbi:MAG: cobalt ABC transporter ATP-binding protein [Chloroflexota bacterium]|nr:MAG: cobalt ABC transporter ATP-binding protein [Chloroflexota bacterium]